MWIQQVNDKFIAIAYNPEKNVSMPMSKPRTSYAETLQWVRKWCGTFCVLPAWLSMKNYRVRVETNDGCVTVWYEKSKAKTADKLILDRVYNQLCGLNIKEISVHPSVWNTKSNCIKVVKSSLKKFMLPILSLQEKLHLQEILLPKL